MGKFILILFGMILSLSVQAQKIHFTDSANVWKEIQPIYNDQYPVYYNYSTYSFKGDSTISSINYRKFSFGLVREDTLAKKVFYREPIGDTDVVLLDYNLNVGDTFKALYKQFPVLKIDSTLINNVWHKVWYFPFNYFGGFYTSMYDSIYVIEGIGCLENPLFMVTNYSSCVECIQPAMYCFSQNGITPSISHQIAWLNNSTSCVTFPALDVHQLLSNKRQLEIFPNPVNNKINISASYLISKIEISNLLGQVLYSKKSNDSSTQIDVSNLLSGIYFIKINGTDVRKFVKE